MHHIGHNNKECGELQKKVDHIIKTSGLLEDVVYFCSEKDEEECFDINLILSNTFSYNEKKDLVYQNGPRYPRRSHHSHNTQIKPHHNVHKITPVKRARLIPESYHYKRSGAANLLQAFTSLFL